MSDIANNAKITLIWRGVLTLLSVLLVAGVGSLISYQNRASEKQDRAFEKLNSISNQTASDVAQIKWELPVIKETARADKEAILKTIQNLEDRVQSMRSLTDSDRREIAELKTTIAVMKHKLQIQ